MTFHHIISFHHIILPHISLIIVGLIIFGHLERMFSLKKLLKTLSGWLNLFSINMRFKMLFFLHGQWVLTLYSKAQRNWPHSCVACSLKSNFTANSHLLTA